MPTLENPMPPANRARQRGDFASAITRRMGAITGESTKSKVVAMVVVAVLVVAAVVGGGLIVHLLHPATKAKTATTAAKKIPVSRTGTTPGSTPPGPAMAGPGGAGILNAPVGQPGTVGGPQGSIGPGQNGTSFLSNGAAGPVAQNNTPGQSGQSPNDNVAQMRPNATAPTTTYQSVAGYGCANTSDHSYVEVGAYSAGKSGWYNVSFGALRGSGCNGSFAAMPMSGNATKDDASERVLWYFNVGAQTRNCSISVLVPASNNTTDVEGNPAQYFVLHGQAANQDDFYSSFTVNQVQHRGGWVNVGGFPVTGGRIAVKLVDRGQDWIGNRKTYAHIAAAQVAVACTG